MTGAKRVRGVALITAMLITALTGSLAAGLAWDNALDVRRTMVLLFHEQGMQVALGEAFHTGAGISKQHPACAMAIKQVGNGVIIRTVRLQLLQSLIQVAITGFFVDESIEIVKARGVQKS